MAASGDGQVLGGGVDEVEWCLVHSFGQGSRRDVVRRLVYSFGQGGGHKIVAGGCGRVDEMGRWLVYSSGQGRGCEVGISEVLAQIGHDGVGRRKLDDGVEMVMAVGLVRSEWEM